ncbi:MAG: Imm53 family immunity protein [Eubacteriales bacterium]
MFDTDLEFLYFAPINIIRSDTNWIKCAVTDGIFRGSGGPRNLEEILEVFCDWVIKK